MWLDSVRPRSQCAGGMLLVQRCYIHVSNCLTFATAFFLRRLQLRDGRRDKVIDRDRVLQACGERRRLAVGETVIPLSPLHIPIATPARGRGGCSRMPQSGRRLAAPRFRRHPRLGTGSRRSRRAWPCRSSARGGPLAGRTARTTAHRPLKKSPVNPPFHPSF